MLRTIITIDEDKCTGCGLCVEACHEAAIALIDGKARLLRDDYCDGLGNCLPVCPTDAIRFEQREAAAYNEQAVLENIVEKELTGDGSVSTLQSKVDTEPSPVNSPVFAATFAPPSELHQWPLQIKLVPTSASYFEGAKLLIAADCSAFAYGNFHADYMRDRITLIGCPKLDGIDYSEKLGVIISENNIASITVVRMEVPCCGGIEFATRTALENSGKDIPLNVITFSIAGDVL